MEVSIVLALVIVLALLTAIYKTLNFPFFSPLSNIPAAHFSAHFSNLWLYYVRYTKQENVVIHKLHESLGPIVRLGPKELSVNCLENGVKQIYSGDFPKHAFYDQFDSYGYEPSTGDNFETDSV